MEQFLNVYNFIPFPEKKSGCYKSNDRHTGVITYTITTRTPLFIPNTSNSDAFKLLTDPEEGKPQEKHSSYDFYSYREMNQLKEGSEDEVKDYTDDPDFPVIPGSELRGMIRNIYETLTDSCMGVLNADNVPVIRPGTSAAFKAGLLMRLENGGYGLKEAWSYTYEDENEPSRKIYLTNEYTEGQKVFIKKERKPDGRFYAKSCSIRKNSECRIPGYIIKGISDATFDKKKGVRIFVEKLQGNTINVTQKDLNRLDTIIQSYQDQSEEGESCYSEYKTRLAAFLRNQGEDKFPVYYDERKFGDEKRIFYLSPACITKDLSHYSIGELAGNMGPCNTLEDLCPACDLFGRIGTSNEDARASKIRFADAYVADKKALEEYYDAIVTLPALAEPKLGCTEFYLKKPGGAKFWTYDYHIEPTSQEGKNRLVIKQGTLRGRKFYWHQPDKEKVADLPVRVKKTILNKTVRPVASGIVFTGQVYFDGISDIQLQQLKWILNCGEDKSGLAYKLGAGKPLGLGSVECRITNITKRTITLANGVISYKEVPDSMEISSYADIKFSKASRDAFVFMSSYKAIDKIKTKNPNIVISYPITENQYDELYNQNQPCGVTEGYKWFEENHTGWKVKPRGHAVREALPELRFDDKGKLIGKLAMRCHKDTE